MGKYDLQHDPRLVSARQHITYLHGLGEATSLGPNDIDLITICLVHHELPQTASQAMFQEAYRLLPTGGAISIMDMDPQAPNFKKFAANPFAFAAFKSTEPWITEYIAIDIESVLRDCGFVDVQIKSNSPRHRTIVAFKG